MVNIGELWQFQAEFYLAKDLKFRGLTSGLNKLKLSRGDKTMTHLVHRSKQKPNYWNWSMRLEQGNSSVHDLCCWTPNFPDEGQVCPRVWTVGLRLQAKVQSKQARIWEQSSQASHCDLAAFLSTVSQPWGLCSAPELSREGWSKPGEGTQSSACSTPICCSMWVWRRERTAFVCLFLHDNSQTQPSTDKNKVHENFPNFLIQECYWRHRSDGDRIPMSHLQSSNTASPMLFHRERSPKAIEWVCLIAQYFLKYTKWKPSIHLFMSPQLKGTKNMWRDLIKIYSR